MILTQGDYDKAIEYRDFLFTRLASDMAGADLVIVGYSLSDSDIKSVVDQVLAIQSKMGGAGGQVYLILYTRDENRAKLFEARGVRVAFGGIDQFSEALARRGPETSLVFSTSNDPIQQSKILSATTIDVKHSISAFKSNASAMFNGWPATYADISNELTFPRSVTNTICSAFKSQTLQFSTIVGSSGVGKTTASRQVSIQLETEGWLCWEHKSDFDVPVGEWIEAATKLESDEIDGLLLIDDAHFHVPSINKLVDSLASKNLKRLRACLESHA